MSASSDFAMLFVRDLKRLREELTAFADEAQLWTVVPGVTNSAGHIALHLEGNLREFVGRRIAGVEFARDRDAEFNGAAIGKGALLARVAQVEAGIVPWLEGLSEERLETAFPQDFMGRDLTRRAMLIHLYGHLGWHLGQIDYLRRVLTGEGALVLSSL